MHTALLWLLLLPILLLKEPSPEDTEPPLSGELKDLIVEIHNSYRSCVALQNGPEYCNRYGTTSQQPGAEFMLEMVWDERLADMAQQWANKCEYNLDRIENLHNAHPEFEDIGSSQSIISFKKRKANINEDPPIERFIKGWFDENKIYSYKPLPPWESGGNTGDYTQMISARTFKIGCGYSYSYNGRKKLPFVHYFTCYYGPMGNIIGKYNYRRGTPSCRRKLQPSKYAGLCRGTHWDVDSMYPN